MRKGRRRHVAFLRCRQDISFPARTNAVAFPLLMDPRDDDIDFDFFEDEPARTEAQASSRVRLPRR